MGYIIMSWQVAGGWRITVLLMNCMSRPAINILLFAGHNGL